MPNQPRYDSLLTMSPDLLEVVLHTPIEVTLSGFVRKAPSPATKNWIQTNFKNWLLKQPENLYLLPYLPRNATPKQAKAFEFKDLYDVRLTPRVETQLDHIIDWFVVKEREFEAQKQERVRQGLPVDPQVVALPRLERMSVEQVMQAADEDMKAANKRATKLLGKKEEETNYKVILEFPGGYRMVKMLTPQALDRESAQMGHCVGNGGYDQELQSGRHQFYSLRDPQNEPHATIQVNNNKTAQIKGKRNQAPARRYWAMLLAFLQQEKIGIEGDYLNVGLIQIRNSETGQYMAITQDQFKDMINDPDHVQGQAILNDHEAGYEQEADVNLGLFTSLYGTDRLSDKLIQKVFGTMPDHAVQVLEHYGNRLTPEQQKVAICSMGVSHESDNMSDLVRIIQPDAATVASVMETLGPQEDEAVKTAHARRDYSYQRRDSSFITGVFKNFPSIYREYLGDDPDRIEQELKVPGRRSAGPFFAFMASKEPVSDDMIGQAFHYMPKEAFKLVRRQNVEFGPDQIMAAFDGYGVHSYSGYGEEDMPLLKEMLGFWKPDPTLFGKLIEARAPVDHRSGTVESANKNIKALMRAAQEVIPDSINTETYQSVAIASQDWQMFKDYFDANSQPSVKMQTAVFGLAIHQYSDNKWIELLSHIQNVDPTVWKLALEQLKPQAPDKTEDKYVDEYDYKTNPDGSFVRDNLGRKVADHTKRKQVKKTVDKDPSEYAKEWQQARRAAAKAFIGPFRALMMKPGATSDENPLPVPDPDKVAAAQAFMDKAGRPNLVNLALKRIGHEDARDYVQGATDNYYGRASDQSSERFQKIMDRMSPQDIVRAVFRTGAERTLFRDVINQHPEWVPELIRLSDSNSTLRRNGPYTTYKGVIYSDLKWTGLDKTKTFEALGYVWGSELSDGIKDDFSAKVFKRFKPKPDQIVPLLTRANTYAATEYLLKKTKKPAPDLVKYVADEFPSLLSMIDLDYISDAQLKDIFSSEDQKQWLRLAKRDLRAYGPRPGTERSKYKDYLYNGRIDRNSPEMAKYVKAAAAAGKADRFERFVRQGELEDQHGELMTTSASNRSGYGEPSTSVNMDMLKQHLDEWSIKSLVAAVHHLHVPGEWSNNKQSPEKDNLDQEAIRDLYFDHFETKKLARLIMAGVLQSGTGWSNRYRTVLPRAHIEKFKSALQLAMETGRKSKNDNLAHAVDAFIEAGYSLDDDALISYLNSSSDWASDYGSDQGALIAYIRDTDSDKIKNWIANSKPSSLGAVRTPSASMVDSLFDHYAKVKIGHKDVVTGKDAEGEPIIGKAKVYSPSYFFSRVVQKWFHDPKAEWYNNTYISRPELEQMLYAEADKRGELAKAVLTATLNRMKVGDKHDFDEPEIPVELIKSLNLKPTDISDQ